MLPPIHPTSPEPTLREGLAQAAMGLSFAGLGETISHGVRSHYLRQTLPSVALRTLVKGPSLAIVGGLFLTALALGGRQALMGQNRDGLSGFLGTMATGVLGGVFGGLTSSALAGLAKGLVGSRLLSFIASAYGMHAGFAASHAAVSRDLTGLHANLFGSQALWGTTTMLLFKGSTQAIKPLSLDPTLGWGLATTTALAADHQLQSALGLTQASAFASITSGIYQLGFFHLGMSGLSIGNTTQRLHNAAHEFGLNTATTLKQAWQPVVLATTPQGITIPTKLLDMSPMKMMKHTLGEIRRGNDAAVKEAISYAKGHPGGEIEGALKTAALRGHSRAIEYWLEKAKAGDSSVRRRIYRFLESIRSDTARLAQERLRAHERAEDGVLPQYNEVLRTPEGAKNFISRGGGQTSTGLTTLWRAVEHNNPAAVDFFVRRAIEGSGTLADNTIARFRQIKFMGCGDAIRRIREGRGW